MTEASFLGRIYFVLRWHSRTGSSLIHAQACLGESFFDFCIFCARRQLYTGLLPWGGRPSALGSSMPNGLDWLWREMLLFLRGKTKLDFQSKCLYFPECLPGCDTKWDRKGETNKYLKYKCVRFVSCSVMECICTVTKGGIIKLSL